ncbi:MAG: CinA family nicotinamide mononucleotide deamidase-related protein [Paludibacter sp.]|nr:CinA family nicotinamide mononucleotide deamidase-related protein [Paludibacter sp.]
MKTEIITIGDEILIGQITDTNSEYIAARMNANGFDVVQITSIHDEKQQIISALNSAFLRADVVLITGGIGPTKDDITKQTLAEYFGMRLIYSNLVYQNILELFKTRSFVMNELTRQQAFVPENAVIFQNHAGTAPILWFERKDGKIAVSMPGVPYEMKMAMESDIIPQLHQRFDIQANVSKNILVAGIPESQLALKIANWENALPPNIHLAYLPQYGIVKLRLSGVSDNSLSLEFIINQQIAALTEILGKSIIAYEDISVEQIISMLLRNNDKTVAVAESCTGGNIAHRLTLLAGSSDIFNGGIVAYSNKLKISILGVKSDDIETYGAVSQQVVEQMAQGVFHITNSNFGIATSGIAGPSGGTAEKPVGTVWIAVCNKDKVVSKVFQFGNLREQNIERATQMAFLMLKDFIEEN